ncbi:MAG: hypothetical protein IKU10_02795 [Clostridia bacterium]|nr:hypothetical protein [Clostridia bacterium]
MKRRAYILIFTFLFVLSGIGGRLTYLTTRTRYSRVATQQSLYTLTVDMPRGTIYDRNGSPLTNRNVVYKYTATATPQIISQIHQQLKGKQLSDALEPLSQRKPAIITTLRNITLKGALRFPCADPLPLYQPAVHLIGYLDTAGEQGLSGLQKEFQAALSCKTPLTVQYACDAVGGALSGVEPIVNRQEARNMGGVLTTLDLELQQIAKEAFPPNKKGAVVIQGIGGGEVLAFYSAPQFSPKQIDAALHNPDLPLLNRGLTLYNVGSVFKLCVAAAALEAGIPASRTYTCTGKIDCSHTFHCHKKEGHGTLTMSQALAQSCNTYFINLAQAVGGESLDQMARLMRLGEPISLTNTLTAQAGQLPVSEELIRSSAELANFAIGQGVLMATPLHLNGIVNTIANGGVYFPPYLVRGILHQDQSTTPFPAPNGQRVLSTQTAHTLLQMMKTVITEGTGQSAQLQTVTAAGKTATAQTGMVHKNKKPINQGWFIGCCPAENPKYAITVLVEDAHSGGQDAAPVFGAICNQLFRNES